MNKKEFPFFSVIIPQKDRAEYLVHTLRTCMLQDYPNFEVIVSDDCSTDNSVEMVQKLIKIDSRIRLFAHKEHLGMRDNFEFALNQVQPGYVIALGGDDGLTPGCIWRMYEILQKTGKQLLTWTPATFCYPDPNADDQRNIFYLKRKRNKGVKIMKSTDFLNKIAKTFRYQIDECPMFYMKGVASTEIVNKVKSRTQDHSFYYCPTPDGFSGVVLAGEVEDYAFTYEPLSIVGSTIKSQGLNYRKTDAKSKKESQQFFNDSIRRTMHRELASQPYSPLVTLMTADYLLTARDLHGWPGKFEMFTFESLIKETFKLLESSYFANEVLIRELKILKEIAIQHNLVDLFNELHKSTIKKHIIAENVYGFVITNSIRFDGSELGINNIYDASLATKFIYNFYNKIDNKQFGRFIKNQFLILKREHKCEYEKLPELD